MVVPFAPATRQCEIHAGSRAELPGGVIVQRVKVAVTIHMHKAAAAGKGQSVQTAQQDAAVAAHDQQKPTSLQNAAHGLRQLQRKGANRLAVANTGAVPCLEVVRRPLERQHFSCTGCPEKPSPCHRHGMVACDANL